MKQCVHCLQTVHTIGKNVHVFWNTGYACAYIGCTLCRLLYAMDQILHSVNEPVHIAMQPLHPSC